MDVFDLGQKTAMLLHTMFALFKTIRFCYGHVILSGVCGAKNPYVLVIRAERDASEDLSMT